MTKVAALKAQAQEAATESTTIKFEFKGQTYTVEREEDTPLELMLLIEQEKVLSAVQYLLGPEQWRLLMASKPRISDLNAIYDGISGASLEKSDT